MTKKNNVKESANTKTPLHSDSTADQRTKRKTKNKLRLHSKLKVNVPLSQSLMLILPSLAKHVSASPQEHDVQDTPNDVIDSEDQRSQEDMNLLAEEHPKSDIIENTAPSDKAEAGNANSEQPQNSTLTPSHHLSSLSHPQVHYVPAVSIPTISSGQVPQPTTHTPVTPDLPVTFLPEVISGKYGELHVDANGHYTFVLNPLSPQYILLHQNQPGTDQFMLHLSNGSQLVVQIPVAGKQDIPTISGDLRGVVIEDHNVDSHGLLSASGKIDVVDPDHDQSSVTAETITGQYGSLSIDANGKWHYQVDNSLSNVQALTSLTSLHESFTIHTKDGTPQTIEMTIGGNDDNAIVSGVDAGSVTEDQTTQVHGQLTVTDSDLGQDHFQASLLTGQFGTLVLSKDGAWTYNLDNWTPAVQKLAHGSTATDIITVHSADGTAHQVTVTINGTNDQAVITSSTAGSPNSFAAIPTNLGSNHVTEDLNTTVVGQLNITDVDSNEAHFSNSDIKGVLGTLHLKDDGGWRYDLDNKNPNVQALGKGNSATDTITIHSADGTPHQITITVNGTNDKAVIGGTSSGAVTEESQLHTSGTLTVTDVDTGEAHFSNTDIAGALGTLHLTDTGGWTYDLDNTNPTVQALGKGATTTDTITVHSADGTPHQVTITVNGTNDKAAIGGTNSGAVTEESQLQASGTLNVTDIDTGEAHFSNADITGALGTLHLTDSGKWTYDLDNTNPTVQALSKGATATDTITVHSTDGTSHQVTITVNGTNDVAVIAGTNTGAVTEESQLHVSGTLTVTDVDTGQAHFSNTDIVGALGTLHLTDTGGWTYDLNNANPTVQALGKGATATDTITVHSADGTPHQVTITVNGTNDAAVIGGTNTGAVTEESQLQASGTLTVTDIDTGEAHFSNTDITGALGTLHLTDSGKWTYDLDNTNPTVQALGKGVTATDTITVHSADGTPHQVTITVNGTNDAAVIGGTNTGAVTEESQLQTSGTLTVTDVDTGQAHFSNTDIVGSLGTLHLTDTGGWTYDLNNANPTVQALGKGATATDTIIVHSADGTPHQVTITVNGTNDAAVIAGTNTGAVTEESQLQTSGTLTVTDVDTGEAHFSNSDIVGALGTLHLTDIGGWTYDLDNTNPIVQALGKGATATDTITVHSADGTPHQVTITINGTNDKAVIGGTNTGVVTEESQLHTSGTLTVTDIDTGEAHFSNTDIVGSFGTLHLTDSGKWTYDLDNTNSTVQALGKGATATDTITVHSADGTPHQVTITVNGTNDKAVIGGTNTGAVTEESQLHVSGILTVTDVDTGEAHFSNTDITGALGTLHLTDSGKWTYDLDNANPNVQALSKGATATDTITVQSADGTSHQVIITVNGTNDKAVIGGTNAGAVTEESQLHASGALTVTDVDTGEAHFSNTDIAGALGTLHLTDSGKWTYDLDNTNSTIQALGKGATATDTITVHSADGTSHQVIITVNGTNDKAVIGGTNAGAVTEESQLHASGALTVTDVDTGEAHFSNTDIAGALGTLHLTDSGKWTYDLDNTNSTIQALGKGATATDTITVHSADGTSHQVIITVNGTNDKAVIGGTNAGAVTEESQLHASGALTVTDVDTGEAHFSNTDIAGALGTLHLTDSGKWTYDLDNTNSTIQALGKGATATDTITVHSADGTSHQVTITINGTNDAAVIAGTNTGAVTEESRLQASGTLTVTDVDTGEAHFSNTDIAGTLGTLHLTDIGGWTYDLDNTNPIVQALGKGATATDTITVHSADGTPHQVTITINGTNDKAVIGGTNTGVVTEESQLHTSGTLTVTDIDTGEAHFSNTDIVGSFGTLHLTDSGKWTYDLDNTNSTVQALGKGATATDTITVHSADGTPHQVTITVNGTNDKAVIGGTNTGAVTEESQLHVSGILTVTDVDTGEAHFSNTDITGALGTLHLTDSGKWTYDLDNANPNVQALSKGATATDTITVQSADGTSHQVIITVNGTNDKAVIGGTNAGAVTEESQLHASGALTVTDVDTGEAHFSNTDIAGALGTLHLTDSGKWTYDLDNTNSTIQALGKGATATDTITVHSADGTSHQVIITVNGTNDKAVIGGTNAGAVTEESQLHASGALTVTDVDTGEAHFSNTDIAGALGTLHLTDSGKWTYDLDNTNSTIQALGKGATATDTITVHSADGTSHQVIITVNGTNDKAVIGGTNAGAVTEESQLHASGALTVTDVDTGEAHFSNTDIAGALGTLHLTDSGKWTYDLDNTNSTIQALGKGATATDTITVHSADGTSHQVTITINGTNDAAVIAGTNTGAVTEESRLQASGTLTVTDVDTGEAHFSNTDIAGTLGTLHLTDTGGWTYDLDNTNPTVQALGKGATATDTITVPSADGTPHQVTITVNGTNDAAVIGGTNTGAVTEESQLQASGTLTVTDIDIDTGEAHFSNTDITGALGTLHLTDSGKWTYDLDNTNPTVQTLGKGATATDTITVHSADGTPHQVTITVNGTNDAAVIGGTNTGSVTEESQLQASGTLTVTDIDTGEAHFSNTDITGALGTLHLTDSGKWTYDLDNTNPTVQALGKGATATDTITVQSADGTPHQVTITVNGTNDKAVIGGTNAGAVTEESQLHVSGTLTVTDVDTGQAHFSNTDIVGSLGTLHLTDTGGWTYDLNNANPTVQALGKGATVTDTITVHSADGTPHQVTITINGTNDKAVIGGTNTGAVAEESQLHTGGTLTVTDVDTGEAHFSNMDITGALGTLHLTDTGGWTYDLDNTNPTVQSLGKGTTATDTITVHSADGTPHQVTITVNGTNDKAVIGGTKTGAVAEESQLHTSGTLTVTDIDTGEAHFSNTDIAGALGTLHLTDTGGWTYDLDNTNPTVQALGKGATATDTITVHSADGTPHQVTIKVNGTNDKAVIGGTSSGAVTEESQLQTSGTLTVTDVDTGEAHFSNTDIVGSFGTLHLTDSGKWTYDLDNTNSTVQALGKGATATDTITVHSADGTPHHVTITVNGTNDKAVIAGIDSGAVTEESQLHTSGTLTVTDIDTDEAHFSNSNIIGTLGTLHLTDSGAWTYDLDNTNPTVQALGKGATATDTITVHSADGTPHQMTITVNGTNDKAVIAGIDSGAVTEESQLHTSGTLTVTDIDTDEAHFSNSNIIGTLGTLHLTDSGAWTYDLDNTNPTVQALGKGATATDTITVHSADGTPHQMTITVNGTNDKAVIGGTSSGAVTEESQLQTSGTLTVTDVDTGEAHFSNTDIAGALGTLHLTDTGGWTYDLDNTNPTVQALGKGATATDTITVHSADGTPHQVTITINGTDDKAIIGGTNTGAVTEESQLHTSGTLTVTDVDTGEAHFSNTDIAGALGTLHLTDTGGWTYDLDNTNPTVQALGKGATTTDTITVHSADGTPHQITITVNGTNDTAVIGGQDTGSVDEGHGHYSDMSPDYGKTQLTSEALYADGKLTIADPDTGDNEFDPKGGGYDYQGQYGRVNLHQDGTWHYMVDIGHNGFTSGTSTTSVGTTIDQLGDGQSLTDTITVYSKDGTSHDIVVTIHGDNDRPYCSSEVQLNSGKEDLAQTITATELLANTIDVDTNDIGKLTIANLHADHGSVVDNKDGTYTFTPTKDYNGQVHFNYDVTDAHGGITATGANLHLQATGDAATINGIDQGNVTEDRGYIDTQYNLHFDGKLDIVDPDQGEAQFDIQRGHTYHGIGYDTKMGGWVLLQQDGTYTYTIDNRKPEIQRLGSTEALVDKVTIHSVDGTSHEIQITIHGTNDDPKVSSVTTLPAGTEDTDVVLHASDLLTNATDIDHNDAGQLSVANLTADHGKITDNHDGTFTFHPALDYNGKVSFTYDVKDAHAGSTATSASMTLAPTSDAAVITGSGSGVKEDINVDISGGHLLGTSGVFHVVDPDGPAQSQFPDVLYGGIYQGSHGGDLQVNSNGNYYYHMSNYLVQHLSEGEILKEEYTIHSVDGTQHKVEFTVEGTNDKPVLSAQSQSVTEGGTLLSGQMHATDVDTKDTHTFTIEKPVDGLTFNNDGSYTFDPSHASYQNLGANNDQVIHVQVKVDDHNGGTDTKTLTLVVHGTNDGATIGGQDTFTVQEDHNLTLNSGNTIIYNGQLTITDADAGEDHFDGNLHQNQQTGTWDTGYTTLEGGKLNLQSNGSYRYEIDNSLAKIQSLGSSETLIDTVTVRSADGTPHQIQVTIQGDNDAPVVSSAVTLTAGTEDTDVVLHASDLLTNATDIDHNDAGQLSVANLTADHGKITDNHDGTFTFHPTQDYNGKVSFTYDVQDAHGGSVATSTSITLAPIRDSAVISGDDTGSIIEDRHVGHSSLQPVAVSGLLSVTDPDAGQEHFQVNRLLGEQAIHDPFGGFLRITPSGAWGYEVANSRLQSLAEGEVEKVVYRVYSADHTAHDITITVTGTNDKPTITATTLAHGTEDTHYQMQASQFGFTDIDTSDTLHSIAITDLPPATQGKFLLNGHDVTAGQHIPTADISKLQFVPAQDFNGDVQFKYTVNDGHTDSAEATNTLHIDAVGDKAFISGVDTGDVYENRNPDMSPDFAQSGMAHLTNSMIHVEGQLTIIDPDTGENSFDSKGIGYTYHGKYGHLILNTDGKWFYGVATGTADVNGGLTTNVGSTIDQLGANETLTDTITIQSKDGTTHDIVITIHGDNDRPYCSSEVQLNSGKEDLAQTITATELLANTIDVDSNDLGKLTVANLLVDHGSVVDNKDGTYTFTPTKDYNGQVHFSYDATDAHGGVTHTGASTTLAAVDDKTIISGVNHGLATEDIGTHMSTNVNIMDAVDWQALQITDVDSPNTQVTIEFAGKQYTWDLGSDLDVTTPYGKFQFHTIASGPHQGEHSWSYIGDNNNVHVQELKHGESLTESIKLIATDGTEFPITVKVNGTEDGIIIDSKSELGHVVENAQTGASVSGSVIAHDVDLHDTVSWTQTQTGGVNGQYGTFHLSADGQWHYDVDQSKATKLGDGDEYWEHFTVEAVSTDGSHVSKSVSVVVHGNNDVPTVSGEVTLPSGKEDTSIHITQAELIANATDVDANDRGWLHVQNLTADHGSLVSNSDGSFTFNPDPNYNGAVHFTYDVADRHGGIAHTGANTTLAPVNDAAVFGGVDTGNVTEDHNAHVSVQGNYAYMLEARGTLTATDTDAGESGFDFKTLMTASAHPEWAPYQSTLGGQLEIDQHGNWNYYIDNRKPEVQSLGVSETLTDTVTVNSKDGTSHIITVTIHGTNDAPILNVQQSSNVSGTLIETDLDTNDTHTFSVVSSNGQFGSLSVDPDTGDYVYTPNTSITGMSYNSATNSYHGVDVFEVKVSDGHTEDSKFITFDTSGHVTMSPTGGLVISTTVPQQPTVTTTLPTMLMVTNVAPTNSVTLDLASTSDSGSSSTDNLTNDTTPTITGHTDIPFSKVTIYDGSTPVGHAVSDASGQYSVAVSSLSEGDHNLSAKALAPSSTLPATSPALSVHVDTDIAPLQVSLTHDTGRSTSDLITSDGALTISGQETGATIEYSIDGGHTWSNTFTPQTGTNTVEVRQTDTAGNVSTSSSLTFTLDNTATAPSVSLTSDSGGSSSDKITNVGDLSVGGIEQGATVEYSIDNGVHWSTQFTPAEGQNNVQVRQTDVAGNVSPSTSLSYTLDTQIDIRVNSAQVDQHGQGMMVQVYFPKDSEITLIEITSDGGGTPLLVDLSTVRKFSTSSSVRNPDHQYQEFVGIDLSSLPDGNLSIRVAGTDTAGNTVSAQSSASSNYVLDTTASTSDDSNTAIEDSIIPVSGNLLSNDADAATVTTTGDIQGTYGTFHLSSDGSYTYTLNNQLSVIQQLDSTSSPLVDSIAYTANDNHGNQATAHLAISIQGTDDNLPPTVTGQTVATNEDTTRTVTTSDFGYSDQDGDALQFVTISSIPSHGLLRLNGKAVTSNQQITKADLDAGHLTFTPISNENGANYAQFTFTANDGHENSASATMIVDVNAVNDAPIVGSSFISSLEDKPHAFTTADFKYSDIEGDALNHITITNVAHGVLTLNGATVNVGDDVSASDIPSLIFTPTHNYFSSNINGLGAVQFTANDGHTDSKEGSIFINIADVADPATFGGDSTGAAQEDTTLQASGTLTASDPDGTVGFIAVQGGVGIVGSKGYGHAHIDSNGHWTYDLYNKHPIVQQLGQGQTDTETITIQSADGTQHDIVITITGTNDLPTVSEKPQAGHIIGQHSVDEDSNLNPAGQLIINDVDGDTTSVALDPTHSAAYGHVVFDAHSGTWVYHLDNSNPTVNALNDNDTLQDKFTLLVDDGHGQKVPQEITMTINGHTDPVPYTPPTISVTVDTRNAHHVTAGITPSTLQAYAHSIRAHATTVSGSHEIKGHGHSDIIIVSGRLHEEAELEGGNDILFLGGRLTDKEIEGGHGSDTLILGAYNRNNAPRLHDHGEKISDGHEEMELESIENIILGDGTVLKGHLPANFPLVTHDHYEVPVNIQAHLSSGDESVSSIRLTHLQQGLTLQSNGHNINANHDGSYTVPANGHLVVVSDRPMNNGHHYFETEVTTHNSVTGVTAVTTEDLQGHIQSHVNPPPPPPPPVQHDEPDSPLTFEASVTIVDDSNTQNEQQHVGVTDSQHQDVSHHGAAAYLDALGIKPDATSTTVHDQPADMDIVLAQVDHPDAATHDQAHLDMSDALEHHDANVNHNQDDEHHHHNDVDGLPDIDPNH